jgi:ABC-2 type transport system permease protein
MTIEVAFMPTVKKLFRFLLCAIQETMAYRASYFINILSQFVSYIVIFFLWKAVYQGGAVIGGMGWKDMQGYLLISLFTSALISGSSEFRVGRSIWTGNIAVELVRPVDYQQANFAITVGNGIAEGVLVAAVGIVFALLIGFTTPPSHPITWLYFVVAMVLAFITKFLIVYIFGLAMFWTTGGMGLAWIRRAITDFFSGAIIPLSFFPIWLQTISDGLPFRGIVFVPAQIFIEKLPASQILATFVLEVGWIVGLWYLAKLIWYFAMRKVTIHGG